MLIRSMDSRSRNSFQHILLNCDDHHVPGFLSSCHLEISVCEILLTLACICSLHHVILALTISFITKKK